MEYIDRGKQLRVDGIPADMTVTVENGWQPGEPPDYADAETILAAMTAEAEALGLYDDERTDPTGHGHDDWYAR
jgi:hypothetical protein